MNMELAEHFMQLPGDLKILQVQDPRRSFIHWSAPKTECLRLAVSVKVPSRMLRTLDHALVRDVRL